VRQLKQELDAQGIVSAVRLVSRALTAARRPFRAARFTNCSRIQSMSERSAIRATAIQDSTLRMSARSFGRRCRNS
jgi:hypothetical protein